MQRPQQYEYEQNQPQQPTSVYQQPNQPVYQQPNQPQYQQPQTAFPPQMQVVVNQPATQQPQPTVVLQQATYQKDKSPNHCLHWGSCTCPNLSYVRIEFCKFCTCPN